MATSASKDLDVFDEEEIYEVDPMLGEEVGWPAVTYSHDFEPTAGDIS